MQAQDAASAALAVRPRAAGLLASDVERARLQDRTVVRTWVQRGTLHLVTAADLAWLLPLLGPLFVAGDQARCRALGLDEVTRVRAVALIRELLTRQGAATRAEIAADLAAHGLPTAGQATIHLIYRAALEGVLCQGPERAGEPAYVLLDAWLDRRPGPLPAWADAAGELAARYLAAYAPATPEDFATWSGLPLREARPAWQALGDRLVAVTIGGRPAAMLAPQAAWLDAAPPPAPVVRLLPSYDPYLLGYRRRDLVVSPEHARRIHPGGGLLHPALLVDGWAAGTWKLERRRAGLEVVVRPFAPLAPPVVPGVAAEVADIGRFLALPAVLRLEPAACPA